MFNLTILWHVQIGTQHCQLIPPHSILLDFRSSHLEVPHLMLQLLYLFPRAILPLQQLHKILPWHSICLPNTHVLGDAIPPSQCHVLKQRSRILHPVFWETVTHQKYRLHFLQPPKQTDRTLSAREFLGLAVPEHLVGAHGWGWVNRTTCNETHEKPRRMQTRFTNEARKMDKSTYHHRCALTERQLGVSCSDHPAIG